MFSALVMACYGSELNLVYWKPIQTGQDSDTTKLKKLTGLPEIHFRESLYHFAYPAAPHYAGRLEGIQIDTDIFSQNLLKFANSNHIIEGVGGLNVPVNDSKLVIDILAILKMPVILVVSPGLGTINHSLLSLEALQNRNIPILGFYVYGRKNDLLENNIHTIQIFSGVTCLGSLDVPVSIQASEDFVLFTKENFDSEGRVKKVLTREL